MLSVAKRFNNNTNIINKFRELALRVVEFGTMADVNIVPFRGDGLPHFTNLTDDQKQKVITNLEIYVSICQSTLDDGHNLKDVRALLWRAIKKFNLTPCSDLFTTLTDEHIVEIYDLENIQLFRNFKFFEYCSYTLEDIFCRPWPELFTRQDQDYMNRLLSIISGALTSKDRFTRPGIDQEHFVEEVDSLSMHKFAYKIKYVSPLFQEKQAAGFVAIEEARIVGESVVQKPKPILRSVPPDLTLDD